ncbi:hypothetical protein Glove_21g231 [Diversispora epigaea]|uniref:Uncharacterized protein n=1 Tax=Diversispora epigaea TaxID=1348612 RepID=A0A397JP49_9GLOM|nr:hypothetical protein Glove_21g231 [Diversispora epigaea]
MNDYSFKYLLLENNMEINYEVTGKRLTLNSRDIKNKVPDLNYMKTLTGKYIIYEKEAHKMRSILDLRSALPFNIKDENYPRWFDYNFSGSVQIFVNTLSERTIILQVESSDTIDENSGKDRRADHKGLQYSEGIYDSRCQ